MCCYSTQTAWNYLWIFADLFWILNGICLSILRHLEAVPFCVNYFHIVSVTYIIAVPICTWLSSWYYCMYIENWTIQLGWYTENRTIQLGGCLNNCTVYELTVSVDTYIKNWTIQLGWCLNILHNYEPTVPNIENYWGTEPFILVVVSIYCTVYEWTVSADLYIWKLNHSAWLLFEYIAVL